MGLSSKKAADLVVVILCSKNKGKLEPDPRNPELILTVRGIGYASQRVEKQQQLWQVEPRLII